MILALFLIIQVLASIGLVLVILMQAAKGGGLAGAFGGMGSSAVFGGRQAATFLGKATVYLAVAFMLNCLILAVLSKTTTQPRSVTQEEINRSPAGTLPMVPQTTPSPQGGQAPGGQTPTEGQPPAPAQGE
jgi:preprotein translocase subunit SecG